ncbi:hypothetical protein GDO78_018281 [Eleutherodactylus coqui]|uniref:long-chain-fatty-acid--CoA ligase n=1 Tax=Eleutherodactylus coqui TaxID=57060 RepID=A0A8J6EQ56_ELECQ|nr:hypothetical protein GDO78_018281 [Eleutherodactylus coqui]
MCCLLTFLFTPLPTSAIFTLIAIGLTAFFYVLTKPKAVHPPIDLKRQSIGTQGGARRSALLKDDTLLSYYYEDAKTLYEVFMRGLRVSGNGDCLGYRKPNQPYQWITYRQVADRAENLGSGFIKKGCKASPEQYIGIFSQNRPEVKQPIRREKTDLSLVVCDKPDKASVLLCNCEKGLTPGLKIIVTMEEFGDDLKERAVKCGVELLLMKDLEYLGKENFKKPVPPSPEDLSVICFTSGTTGDPKGAMLTHKNIVADASSFLKATESTIAPVASDIEISYLPMAHLFERVVQTVVFCSGAKVGFSQGDIRLLTDDMQALRPTVFPTVPRLLNRIYDKIQSGASTPTKKFLLDLATTCKFAEVKKGINRNDSVWDKFIFKKVQDTMGGRVRLIVTGAAPISPNVLTFLRAALGTQIFEGYGQTECGAACSFTTPGDWTAGHVGAPLPCNLLKLVDVVDMNYFTSNGEGEVCIKGPNVFGGYLKDPEKTAEAIDEEGWLHTGDIGKWLPNGTLKIIDRKKNIFKLAQGEYIAPEKIENVYVHSAPVAQVFVHGDSLRVKDIYVHPEMLSVENGLLTPTLKAKRAEVAKYFHSQIDDLYAKIQD